MSENGHGRLARLLAPKSIAFIGGSIAAMTIERCKEIGFDGKIWPVHPTRRELAGYSCHASLADLPGVPDAAFIGVNRELTIDAVQILAAMGAGGGVCYAAGFAEMGEEGRQLQDQLVAAAGDMPLIGPNCFGFVNYVDRCALWPYLFGGTPGDRGVALISQSGNIAMNLSMNQRSVKLTHLIGAGNQAMLGPADYVEALLEDERVSAIGMYIEGVDDIDRFGQAALKAMQKGVPIVVMKVGRTKASAEQSKSHTSSLTGSDALYDAFFERLGIIRVNSLNRLLETLKVLDLAGPLTGHNIMTLSCSGGEAATIADLVPEFGLETGPFSKERLADLEAQFPNYVTVSNPFDYNTSIWGRPDEMERCFTSAMRDDHDAAFLVYDHPTVECEAVGEWVDALDSFIAAHQSTGKPAFVICTISELLPAAIRERMLAGGVVPLQGLEDGLYAYAAAARYHEFRREHGDAVTVPRNASLIEHANAVVLDEWTSKISLAEFGLAIPVGAVASADELPAIAEKFAYPLVLKAKGEAFLHKSDVGAVRLNLNNADEVSAAAAAIADACAQKGLPVAEFLIERMVEDVVAEVIVGIKRDDQFGPALVIGSGGIFVELLADSRSLLLPTDRNAVERALRSLAIGKLLEGFRGNPAGDMEALLDAVLAIAAYAESAWDSLLELDVNPLLVLPDGQGVVAADALILLHTDADNAGSNL